MNASDIKYIKIKLMVAHYLCADHHHAGHNKQQSQQRGANLQPVSKIHPANA